ncbi:MAG: hypothetical protein KGJ10_02905 [Acidobacteriota bacterium]|nr:hypothetical protein [Acidobacteriota bacterium]MDE3043762.1 hypothetical protein [Acidobacteriota bacterium]MDE3107219.1 hypothetical protein [Acidobacteriota bacterium]
MTDTYNKPGVMSNTPEEVEFELRAHIGSIWTGGRLFIGMYTFMIAALAFSYFYLRSSNNSMEWRPNHVTAPTAYGWAIYGCTAAMSLLAIFGQSRLRKGQVADWLVAGWTAVGIGLLALFLQLWEFVALPFYPGSSGYASTFIGFGVMNVITLFVTTYWLETSVARAHAMKREFGAGAVLAKTAEARSWRANVASMTYFQGFAVLVATMLLLMFYVL